MKKAKTKMTRAMTNERNGNIVKDLKTMSYAQVAKKYGMSENNVRYVEKKTKAPAFIQRAESLAHDVPESEVVVPQPASMSLPEETNEPVGKTARFGIEIDGVFYGLGKIELTGGGK